MKKEKCSATADEKAKIMKSDMQKLASIAESTLVDNCARREARDELMKWARAYDEDDYDFATWSDLAERIIEAYYVNSPKLTKPKKKLKLKKKKKLKDHDKLRSDIEHLQGVVFRIANTLYTLAESELEELRPSVDDESVDDESGSPLIRQNKECGYFEVDGEVYRIPWSVVVDCIRKELI